MCKGSKSKCLETLSMQDCEDLENTVSGAFLVLEKKLYDFVMYLQSVTIISWTWFISHQQCSVLMILHVHTGSISCWWHVCPATTKIHTSSDEIFKILFWNKMVLHWNVPIKFCYFLHYKHFNEKFKPNYNDICNSIIVLNRTYIVQYSYHIRIELSTH